jgi:hypothetical protein
MQFKINFEFENNKLKFNLEFDFTNINFKDIFKSKKSKLIIKIIFFIINLLLMIKF